MEQQAQRPEGSNENDVDLPSCDGCRKRKLRCSRDWPTCSHCRRLGQNCTYEYQKKKPGVKGGAVEALSRRVEILENLMLDDTERERCQQSRGPHSDSQHIDTSSLNSHALGEVLSALTGEIHQLNANMRQKSSDDALITTSSLSTRQFTRQDGRACVPERPAKRIRLDHCAKHNASAGEVASPTLLTRNDLVEELIDVYFSNIHPWIPILHEARFRSKICHQASRKESMIILHAILVASLRLVDEKAFDIPVPVIENEVQKSREYLILNAMGNLTVENLQALVIASFNDIGRGQASKAWSTIGSLTRTVQYLHLSVEKDDLFEPAALLEDLPLLDSPADWIEEEERRRVFWSIFVLDRFCSISTGWNVSLTADDVCRRLPIDGGLWKRNQPALTPYLGIWDHSAAKIGHTITFLPSKFDNSHRYHETNNPDGATFVETPGTHQGNTPNATAEMSKIGAFAYYIESIESLSRINTYFVQQKIDFANRQEVFSWLTRFKELDLRLVHWKMFLPQRWKSPDVAPIQATTTAMDPNMTLAHITHNMSSILLHQRIAYPSNDIVHLRLPNACSADTCFVAATETANITVKYLDHAPVRRVIAPYFAISAFVSAKVLLVHSLHYADELAPEFWTLVQSLETMSLTWKGRLAQAEREPEPLAGCLAKQLRKLHALCKDDPRNYPMASFGRFSQGPIYGTSPRSDSGHDGQASRDSDSEQRSGYNPDRANLEMANSTSDRSNLQGSKSTPQETHTKPFPLDQSISEEALPSLNSQLPIMEGVADDLSTISQGLLDQSFIEMNRIINFDDFFFSTDISGRDSL